MEPHIPAAIGDTMIDHQKFLESAGIDNLTAELKKFLNETRSRLKGCERRKFMAKVRSAYGQRRSASC